VVFVGYFGGTQQIAAHNEMVASGMYEYKIEEFQRQFDEWLATR
jgi:hypothetical protein